MQKGQNGLNEKPTQQKRLESLFNVRNVSSRLHSSTLVQFHDAQCYKIVNLRHYIYEMKKNVIYIPFS